MLPLRVTAIQSDLHWENSGANLAMFEEKIWQIGQKTDVIVLPEMFSTGFTMNARSLAESMGLNTFRWMKQMAAQTDALMLGSFIAAEEGKFFNRLLWMEPSGKFHVYDKHHLFRLAKEDETFSAGHELLVAEWRGWRICPIICYDLRFPAWCRNRYDPITKSLSYDVLIIIANWTPARMDAWTALLKARAIENLAFVVGVNRVGTDGKGVLYSGKTASFGPKGETLLDRDDEEAIDTITFDGNALHEFREKFPAYLDNDKFAFE
jgi:omega-amidase